MVAGAKGGQVLGPQSVGGYLTLTGLNPAWEPPSLISPAPFVEQEPELQSCSLSRPHLQSYLKDSTSMLKNLLALNKDLSTSCKRHTVFCGEHIFISYQLLHRAHDKVNILGGGALDLLPPLVIPVVLSVETETLVRVTTLPNAHPSVGSHSYSTNTKAVAVGWAS